ncbi:MAG: hypothetical protein LBU76_05380, partial [Azoarcus sp.]|nr:hypothetical protein [Azoarcus sp.]
MSNEFKYYMLKRKGDQSYPMLRVDSREYDENRNIKLMYLELNSPIPSKPVMADFLYSPASITLS